MRIEREKAISRVFRALQEAGGWVWIREVARMTDLHPEQVRRVVDQDLREAIEEMNSPVRLRLVRLREHISLERHLRYVRLMEETGHRAARSRDGLEAY